MPAQEQLLKAELKQHKYIMLLYEFFYFNNENNLDNDLRYDADRDSSVIKLNDTRKVRLTLKQINYLRKQSEAHDKEKMEELQFIKSMYGAPIEPTE